MIRVGQNQVYINFAGKSPNIYGHIWCIYLVKADPMNDPSSAKAWCLPRPWFKVLKLVAMTPLVWATLAGLTRLFRLLYMLHHCRLPCFCTSLQCMSLQYTAVFLYKTVYVTVTSLHNAVFSEGFLPQLSYIIHLNTATEPTNLQSSTSGSTLLVPYCSLWFLVVPCSLWFLMVPYGSLWFNTQVLAHAVWTWSVWSMILEWKGWCRGRGPAGVCMSVSVRVRAAVRIVSCVCVCLYAFSFWYLYDVLPSPL